MTDIPPHFTHDELACPLTGEVRTAPDFLWILGGSRLAYGLPMVLTSCCRSLPHNQAIGGHTRSLHLIDNPYHSIDTCACDVSRNSRDFDLGRFVAIMWAMGWSIRIYKTHVHIDQRTRYLGLPQTLVVVYE